MPPELIRSYLSQRGQSDVDPGFLAYLANLERVAGVSPEIARAIVQELVDQRSNIKLIASENYSSLAIQCAMANLLTDKYAEGHPFQPLLTVPRLKGVTKSIRYGSQDPPIFLDQC